MTNWDKRFETPDYLFGREPAAFLTAHAGFLRPGANALSVADGEGRNAVWLAQQGCHVTAFDSSRVAQDKARALANEAGVALTLELSDIYDWRWDAAQYDVVLAVFIQFVPPERRAELFDGLRRAVAPGGLLMLHGYTPEQVALGTGGPASESQMYTVPMLREAFADMTILRLESYERNLSEGAGHNGHSALIDLIARQPG